MNFDKTYNQEDLKILLGKVLDSLIFPEKRDTIKKLKSLINASRNRGLYPKFGSSLLIVLNRIHQGIWMNNKYLDLQTQRDIASKLLSQLLLTRAIETDVDTKFKLDHQIKKCELGLREIENELESFEKRFLKELEEC